MNKEYIDKFLKIYNQILLYVFLITICIPIVLYIINPSAFIYETEVYDPNYIYTYQTISLEDERAMRNKITLYTIIGTTCIAGMIISNPDARRNIKKVYERMNDEESKR